MSLRSVIMQRDNCSNADFDDIIHEILRYECNSDGTLLFDPEESLLEYFGVEPDFIFDLLEELENAA